MLKADVAALAKFSANSIGPASQCVANMDDAVYPVEIVYLVEIVI